jgi:hypothetical protein
MRGRGDRTRGFLRRAGPGTGRAATERPAQPVDRGRRLVVDLAPGDVERAPPLVVELLVSRQLGAGALAPLVVVLHRPVCLTNRAVLVPAEVHSPDEAMLPPDVHLQVRWPDPVLGEPDPGDALQRRLRPAVGEAEHLARANDPRPLPAVLKDDREFHLDHDVAVQHRVRGHDSRHEPRRPRDVHDGPRWGGDRDAEGGANVILGQRRDPDERAMDKRPAGFLRPARQRDQRDRSSLGQQHVDSVQVRGGLMARDQSRVPPDHGPYGDGMQPPRVIRQAFQPLGRRVNAARDRRNQPIARPPAKLIPGHPSRKQLGRRSHPTATEKY